MPAVLFTCPPFCLLARYMVYMPAILFAYPPRHFPWFCPSSLHKQCARHFILPIILLIPTSLFKCPPLCLRARHSVDPHQCLHARHSIYMPAILLTCPSFRRSPLVFTCPPFYLHARHSAYVPVIWSIILPIVSLVPTSLFTCPSF